MELNEEELAIYLKNNPDFFLRHNDIVASINLQGRSGNKTISLHERQVLVLREKIKAFERKLSEFIAVAKQNDQLQQQLHQWLLEVLKMPKDKLLPFAIVRTLKQHFSLPQITIKLWRLCAEYSEQEYTRDISEQDCHYINKLNQPYCGNKKNIAVSRWLPDSSTVNSIAVIPLRAKHEQLARGALLFGSPDEDRFTKEMSTDLLTDIAELITSMQQFMQLNE